MEQVVDAYLNVHILTDKLGEGGQGIVYRTRDSDIAIKLVTDGKEPLTDGAAIEKTNNSFERIRFLPIPETLPLARPSALLKGRAGYVMRLLSGMLPFDCFGFTWQHFDSDDEPIPDWLSHLSKVRARKLLHYHKTGGLKRRLSALSWAASILAQLHCRGLVYGDVSHNNIFISESSDPPVVWFIDADNLQYAGSGASIYTPRFGAPELVQETADCSFFSDCYAFAVLSFWMLTMQHPFEGKALAESGDDEDDWDNDKANNGPEYKAYAGLFLFIDDPRDDSNRAGGFPRKLFLNDPLKAFFEKTFCEGRRIPKQRPSALLWARELAAAADQCVVCPSCGMSYYYTEKQCPYCDQKKPQILMAKSYLLEKYGNTKVRWIFVRELADTPIVLPQRLFCGFSAQNNSIPELEVSLMECELLLKRPEQASIDITINGDPLPPQSRLREKEFFLETKTRRVSITIGGGA